MADWYVSQKVAVSGAGTSLAVAFKTIAEAVAAAVTSGDTIYIQDGVYNESILTSGGISLNIICKGHVILDGGGVLTDGITAGGVTGNILRLDNLIVKNFTNSSFITNANHDAGDFRDCLFFNPIKQSTITRRLNAEYSRCIFLDDFTAYGGVCGQEFTKCLFINALVRFTSFVNYLRECLLVDCDLLWQTDPTEEPTSNFYGCSMGFNAQASVAVNDSAEMLAKYIADGGVEAWDFTVNTFYEPLFNNITKNNYTPVYDNALNPVAFSASDGSARGAYEPSLNIICKETSNGGNCDIYDISTDFYGLGLFAGITNVANIDNGLEKIERTIDGANNWGVFVANIEYTKTEVWNNILMFGDLLIGGQISKLPSDFAYNYQIDILVKFSDVLTKAQLLADTAVDFIRFRLRPNEQNFYVDNGGVLIGDGEPTYLGLVDSSDGGSGSLVPQKIIAKSFVAVLILRDN